MNEYLLLYQSITRAQMAARVLQAAKISASLGRSPRDMANISCGYALTVGAGEYDRAQALLQRRTLAPERTLVGFYGRKDGSR